MYGNALMMMKDAENVTQKYDLTLVGNEASLSKIHLRTTAAHGRRNRVGQVSHGPTNICVG